MLAQLLGLIALLIIVLSYQQKDKNKYLFYQLISNMFYLIQYIILGAYSGASETFIAIARNFTYYNFSKKNKLIPIFVLILFELLAMITGFLTYNNIWSLLPVIIVVAYNYGNWQKNLKITYLICFVSAILWLIYNLIVGAYTAALGSCIETIGCFIGLIKYKKISKD